jgi:hypothetical protein
VRIIEDGLGTHIALSIPAEQTRHFIATGFLHERFSAAVAFSDKRLRHGFLDQMSRDDFVLPTVFYVSGAGAVEYVRTSADDDFRHDSPDNSFCRIAG